MIGSFWWSRQQTGDEPLEYHALLGLFGRKRYEDGTYGHRLLWFIPLPF